MTQKNNIFSGGDGFFADQFGIAIGIALIDAQKNFPHARIHRHISDVIGMFIKKILGTLNHIMVADIVWLKRFSNHPAQHSALDEIRATPQPQALAQILIDDFAALTGQRRELDKTIIAWCEQLDPADLGYTLAYENMKGEEL